MRKTWTLFKREYRTAVRTKSFLISLLLVPLLMGGGFIAMIIMENRTDTEDKHFVVLDHTGQLTEPLKQSLETRNTVEIFNRETGEKTDPAYIVEFMEPDTADPVTQQLALSNRVKSQELHAFIEIGPGFIFPSGKGADGFLKYYSEHSFNDNMRYWFRNVLNQHAQQMRTSAMNISEEDAAALFQWTDVEGMGLVSVDKKTGEQQEAEESNPLQSFLVPYVMVLLMFMMVMMSAMPLLTTVMEEKNEKIAEVLLGSITPFQFMMGKVLGGIGVSLTVAAIYVGAGVFTMSYLGVGSLIPFDVLPWFFIYTILFILMVGSGMAALGSTCNDSKDASSLTFPAILPAILPLLLIAPVVSDPTGPLATTLAFIPPFTPTMMVIRISTPVTIPIWQPIVGLIAVALFTWFTVWVGARVFRTAILIQGQKPTAANLFKYAFKS